MTTDNKPDDSTKPEGVADSRSTRPATIDLKAGEFTSETSAAGAEIPPEPETTNTDDTERSSEAFGENAAPEAPRRTRGGSPWSVIAIAAAAAALFFVIGFGASHWLAGRLFAPTAAVEPAQFVSDPEIQTRLSKLEAAAAAPRQAAPRQADPQLLARIAAAEAAVKTATDMAATRERRIDEVAQMARDAGERATSAATTAEAAKKANPDTAESRAEIDTLTSRIATLEQSTRALEQAARSNETELKRRANEPVDDVRSRLAVVSMALRNAVENGVPFNTELTAAKALSADARAVTTLEPFAAGGVPTASALGRELEGLMPAIWKTGRAQDTSQGTFLERLQANAGKIVRIRPAGDVAGDEPGNVKARIEARAENADIRGALAELAKLPPDARAPAQNWIAKAQARDVAIAAARDLLQSALNALTKSGS